MTLQSANAISGSDSPQETAGRIFREFYTQNAFQFAAADIFCIDSVELPVRLAELVIIFLFGVRDEEGANPICEYLIVLPPTPAPHAEVEGAIRQHIADGVKLGEVAPSRRKRRRF